MQVSPEIVGSDEVKEWERCVLRRQHVSEVAHGACEALKQAEGAVRGAGFTEGLREDELGEALTAMDVLRIPGEAIQQQEHEPTAGNAVTDTLSKQHNVN